MHGAPPKDFPVQAMREYFELHGKLGDDHGHDHGHEHAQHSQAGDVASRFAALEEKMRNWPRNPENDPFHAGSEALARELEEATGLKVVLAFNEFCAPSVDAALDMAISNGAERVIAVTPMMTSGGGHSEKDIPSALGRAKQRHPDIRFEYAWPYPAKAVGEFLARQIDRFV
jgi:sirohydrochlorin cobaltochelatase